MIMVVILNPAAGGGKALKKWRKMEPHLRQRFEEFQTFVLNRSMNLPDTINRALKEGHRHFIAAGGDGTVNLLMNAILDSASPEVLTEIRIGAIGLGSSNDFHKPFDSRQRIGRIPCRVDFEKAELRDVGMVTYKNGAGSVQIRHWLLNASIGITANANHFFNNPDSILAWLKIRSTSVAILYAALRILIRHRNQELDLALGDDGDCRVKVTNLGIVKSPHFSGNFCYDSPFEPDSGNYYIHLCEDMSRKRMVLTMARLLKRKFSGAPNTQSRRSSQIDIRSARSFALEFDGERNSRECVDRSPG
jgi:diacylglycerol kinase family enzyme